MPVSALSRPVLVADLYGDSRRQILIAGRDDAHEQHLAIYSLDSIREPGAEPLITLNPGPDLIAYDVGRLGDDDALLFIEPGRVLRYSFEDGDFVEFIKIRSIYGQQRSGDIVPIDFFRDIDGDGRDDLIVPDTAGYRIRLQKTDGSLGEESLLEESSRMTVTGGVVSFESRPLFSGDVELRRPYRPRRMARQHSARLPAVTRPPLPEQTRHRPTRTRPAV